jgi:hypothetical protein
MLLKLFQKTQSERTPPKLFHKASITLIPKPGKNTTKKVIPISLKNRCKKFSIKYMQTESYNALKSHTQ